MAATSTEARIEYVVIAPDGGWGWFVVFTAFLWNLIVDGTVYTFGLFLDDMKKDFKVSTALLSVASSIQMGFYFLLGPLIAAMINRLGFRVVSMVGGTLAFAGVLGSAYVENIYAFICTFGALLGVAFSMTYLCNVLVVGFYFSKYRAVATCISVTGTALGVSVFPIIFSVLLTGIHWRDKYKYISGAHLLMVFMGLAYKPVRPSAVIVGGGDQDRESEIFSVWETYDRPERKNSDYPTRAEALQNQEYTLITPYDITSEADSRQSFRSNRTARSTRGYSLSTIHTQHSEIPKYRRRKCCCCFCKCKYVLCPCLWHDIRPMYRDDILYHGSTRSLRQLGRIDKLKAKMQYQMTVTRTAAPIDTPENADCCNCCPDSVTRVLNTMLDVSLLKSLAFLLLCFSGFLSYLGLYVPYVYGIELSIAHNVDHIKATYILTALGLSNALGRILSGILTLIPKANAMIISQVTLCIAGTAVAVHPFFDQFATHLVCICVFGLNIATIASLRTIVLVDLLGLEKLTNAFGLIVLMEGLSSLIALPLNSFLYDTRKNFIYPFVFSGFVIILSGLILIPVVPLYKAERRREERKAQLEKEQRYEEAKRAAIGKAVPARH